MTQCRSRTWRALRSLCCVLAAAAVVRGEPDWSSTCPSFCKCKWFSGKKVAECSSQALTAVPNGLSPEIQSLDLSENPLKSLPSDAFRSVGLVNLHKINMQDCQIEEIDKDAFKGLQILIELNLSNNKIHTLHPLTFRDNPRLRVLLMPHNRQLTKLEDGLFFNMTFLQTVDAGDCRLAHVGPKAFSIVPTLIHLKLASNRLTHIKLAAVEGLTKLQTLELHENPWLCDCHLRALRDWVISRNLYAQPTLCAEPPKLSRTAWNEVDSQGFACRPRIVFPPADKLTSVEASGEDVTLSCLVRGDPEPRINWVINTRVISNTTSSNFGERYQLRYGSGWANLTIGRVRPSDRGEFKCVAESLGGMDERNVTLVVGASTGGGPLSHVTRGDGWVLVLGLITGLLALLLLALVLCCCVCRRRRPPPKKPPPSANGDLPHPHSLSAEKSLLTVVNPVQKPPRRYDDRPTELAELHRNLLDDTGTTVGTECDDTLPATVCTPAGAGDHVHALGGAAHYPPDLLAFPRGLSTPPLALGSPVHTLPYSRSQSPFSPTRPGYVTIPRRPRVPSWSSAPTPTLPLLDDPLGLGLGLGLKAEPVYDNLGPRTTADGSSVLSLNKSGIEPQTGRPRPVPLHCSTLPTPARRANAARSTPEGAPLSPLSRTVSSEGPLSPVKPKVPPKPPPKPKKNGPLYEDEGEDGTEV